MAGSFQARIFHGTSLSKQRNLCRYLENGRLSPSIDLKVGPLQLLSVGWTF